MCLHGHLYFIVLETANKYLKVENGELWLKTNFDEDMEKNFTVRIRISKRKAKYFLKEII